MADVTESEARILLGRPLVCLDCGDWTPSKDQPGMLRIGAGLTDEHGGATHLSVELRYRQSAKTKLKTFIFTVLMRSEYGDDRVYQLEVKQAGKQIKDEHKRPHEHYGKRRRVGPDKWRSWGYDEILQYFCGQTRIDFRPVPSNPGQLQGTKKP
jgi:hypothetical protein